MRGPSPRSSNKRLRVRQSAQAPPPQEYTPCLRESLLSGNSAQSTSGYADWIRIKMGADPRVRRFVRMGRRVLESASGYQGLLISRPYFGARSISRAIISGLGGPDGPSNLTTGSPISVQRFSNPAGVKMTNAFPGLVPMFWYVCRVPLGTPGKMSLD